MPAAQLGQAYSALLAPAGAAAALGTARRAAVLQRAARPPSQRWGGYENKERRGSHENFVAHSR